MDDHDPCCFMSGERPCPVCAAISDARSQEKVTFTNTWKANLPLMERRWYLDGYKTGYARAEMPARFR